MLATRRSSRVPGTGIAPRADPSTFYGQAGTPGILVLGVHYVTDDPSDSDSTRLLELLRTTQVGRFCGVTYGDMPARVGFFRHNFKTSIPVSDAEIVCLDYFWMQRGGGWIALRYGTNWIAKIEHAFTGSLTLRVVLVPKAGELFGGDMPEDFSPQLKMTCVDATSAEALHPLVVATIQRDAGHPSTASWFTEGRMHSLQIARYAPEGFVAVHQFSNDCELSDYLRLICTSPAAAARW